MTNPDNVGGQKPLIPRLKCLASLLQQLNAQTACQAVNDAIAEIELCRAAPAGGELTENERRRAATFKIPQVGWACVSRQQSLPEPADCDWPMCGCDPYADKVIEALQDDGVIRDHSAPAGGDVPFDTVRSVCRALTRLGHTTPDSQEEQAARAVELVDTLCREVQSHFDSLGSAPVECDLDERALQVARRFTRDGDPQTRAIVQTAVASVLQDSAPAGSGEVSRLELARMELAVTAALFNYSGESSVHKNLQATAALLRKLQHGADYLLPRKIAEAYCRRMMKSDQFLPRYTEMFQQILLEIAASQDQEGGHANG